MREVTIQSGAEVRGLRTIKIESESLRLVVLPEAGAKVWQIHYKSLGSDLLWNNPSLSPAKQPLHASYDDTWSGGWDELFPNDEAGDVFGVGLPDHGELWTGEWKAETVDVDGTSALRLRFETPISRFSVEKILLLRRDRPVLEVRYRLTNRGTERYPFLFKLHPAFAVSATHRIDFPAMTVRREPDFAGTLGEAPLTFAWPDAQLGDSVLDLRQVPREDSGAVHFFYGTELEAGWCGITNRANRLAVGLRFDREVFGSCWLFATHGGWRELNVAVLEPATGYPYKMRSMIEGGQARWLAPGESLETSVLFSVMEGLTSIGAVEEDGMIQPGDES
jgi:galactose mutarotase-like enzyme